jgi:hypothetical protein
MKRVIVLVSLWAMASATVLGACGKPLGTGAEHPQRPHGSAVASQEEPSSPRGAHCHEERPTGSNIGRTVCRSDEDVDGSRDAARTFMNRRPSSPTAKDAPSTGVPNSNPFPADKRF